ncbi:CLUMA_CG005255, isoform A [Clunio marinus]|uniref:CLUMA_CG005255, isoform A n=1 Tax=Clunio marinus TaxID=568069 RepID=A0A1J1HZP1_9DIPT|nr:CLUMA_CG005255, isoform A [Clunio marinus]
MKIYLIFSSRGAQLNHSQAPLKVLNQNTGETLNSLGLCDCLLHNLEFKCTPQNFDHAMEINSVSVWCFNKPQHNLIRGFNALRMKFGMLPIIQNIIANRKHCDGYQKSSQAMKIELDSTLTQCAITELWFLFTLNYCGVECFWQLRMRKQQTDVVNYAKIDDEQLRKTEFKLDKKQEVFMEFQTKPHHHLSQ